jgi:hypothetical protein
MVTAGLSDDDLRETAYEVLLVSVGAAGYSFVLSYMPSLDFEFFSLDEMKAN